MKNIIAQKNLCELLFHKSKTKTNSKKIYKYIVVNY